MTPSTLPHRFAAAWNAHDMPALAGLFAADAHFVNVVGMYWKGRDEIERAHRATHDTIFKASMLSVQDICVQEVMPGCASVHARWRLEGQTTPSGAPDAVREGYLLFVARQDDDDWTIVSAQNTDIVLHLLAPTTAPD